MNLYFSHIYASGSNHLTMRDSPYHSSFVNTGTGWVPSTQPVAEAAHMDSAVVRSAGSFVPLGNIDDYGINNSIGDCYRIPSPLKGNFVAGSWTIDIRVALVAGSGGAGRHRFRLWKSTSPTGASATPVYGPPPHLGAGGTITYSAAASSNAVISLPEIRLVDEYLFLQSIWEIRTKSGNTSTQLRVRMGNNAAYSAVKTPQFIPDQDLTFGGMLDNLIIHPSNTDPAFSAGPVTITHKPIHEIAPVTTVDRFVSSLDPGPVTVETDGFDIEPIFGPLEISYSARETTWLLGEYII